MDYLARVNQEHGRWFGHLPDLDVYTSGKSEEDIISRLEVTAGGVITQFLAEGRTLPSLSHFTKEDFGEDDFPIHGEATFHWITPRLPNPVSLSIKQALERSGKTASEIARLMGTSSAAITRMTDPNYDSHSLFSLRKLAAALDMPIQRFVALKELALDEFLAVGHPGMHAPGHVTLKRTPELERLTLPALVQWEGLLFWLDAPARPPYAVSDQDFLRFEGAQVNDEGFTVGILTS